MVSQSFVPSSITPSDTTDIPGGPVQGLYVQVAGTIVINTPGDNGVPISLPSTPATTVIPFTVTRVRATGTSATLLGLRD